MKKMNKKGFTLIELLAVIVILGVVMAIAIPSMNKVIDNSKKDTLISTALEYINGAKTSLLSSNDLPDYGKALIVPISKIELDRGGKSPYTSTAFDDTQSYVVVVNESNVNAAAGASEYTYYIALMDTSRNCLNPTSEALLNNKAKTTRTYVQSGTACKNEAAIVKAANGTLSLNSSVSNGVAEITPTAAVTYELYQ